MAVIASEDWYEVIDHDHFELSQGDIVENITVVDPDAAYSSQEGGLPAIRLRYGVILSQDCDLVSGRGHTHAILCPAITLDQLDREGRNVRNMWNDARKQRLVNYFALPQCTIENWQCQPRLVDFGQVYQLSLSRIEMLSQVKEMRTRLRPPYRYGLARHFAAKFSRLGLDQPLPEWGDAQAFRDVGGSN